MKLNNLSTQVSMSDTGTTSRFNMDANAKAFRVMSDTLYQNKIGSMVREVSCNAYDSHVMAGYGDRPFQIHLPDTFEPFFSVRDFGLGLDDAGVREVFTTYFRSTKDNDNTVVGAFGLGSKTPFAYTDAFTIVAIKDGAKRTYSAFIAEDGLPCITVLNESATDEGNGVEIIVPVTATSDFSRFRNEVRNQLAFFTVKPEILNCESDIEWADWQGADSYMNCENVLIGNSSTSFRGVWILQGVVGYKMDTALVSESISPENREFLEIIGNAALLKFDLGQIEVNPSREGVSYNKFTLTNIEKALNAARLSIAQTIQSQIDAFPDAYALALGVNSDETLCRLAKVTKPDMARPGYFRSNGKVFIELQRMADLSDDMAVVTKDDEDEDENEYVTCGSLIFKQYASEFVRRKWKFVERGVGKYAQVNRNLSILVRDTNDKPVVRTREWLACRSNKEQVFILQNRDGTAVTADQLNALIDRIGESFSYTLLSEVELPQAEARSNNGYRVPTAYVYGQNDDKESTRYWERETCKLGDFTDGAYYVKVDRHNLYNGAYATPVYMMASAGLLDRPVVAIRERDFAKIADNPKWIHISDKGKEIIDSITSNRSLARMYDIMTSEKVDLDILMDSDTRRIVVDSFKDGSLSKDSPLYRLCRLNSFAERMQERAFRRGFSEVAEYAFGQAYDRKPSINFECLKTEVARLMDETRSRHPLLPFLSNNYFRGRWTGVNSVSKEIVQYVNLTAGA